MVFSAQFSHNSLAEILWLFSLRMKKHRPKQGRRKELKTQLTTISEEIEELRFEEKSVVQTFDKEDAAGMK